MKYYLQKIGKSYYKCWYTKQDDKYIKHRQTLGPISKSLADEIIRKINEDNIRNIYNLTPRDRSFIEFVEEFKKFRQTLPPKTQARDQGIISKFIELTHISYVSEFDLKLVETYIGQRKAQNPTLRNTSINKELNTLSVMAKKMKHWKYTSRNVLEDLQRLPEQEVTPKFFTDAELQKIFTTFTSGWLTMAYLGYYCGLRLEEAVKLTTDNILWETKTLLLVASKTGKARGIPIATPLYNHLLSLKQQNYFNKNKYIVQFPKAEIKSTSSVSHVLHKKLNNIGIKDKYYRCFRHTFATHLRRANENQANIKDLLGHSSFEMTNRYGHATPNKSLVEAVQKLEELNIIGQT